MPGKNINANPKTQCFNNKKSSSSKIGWKKESNPAVGFSTALIIAGIEIVVGYLIFLLFCH